MKIFGQNSDPRSSMAQVIDILSGQFVTERDRALLGLVFAEAPTQKMLDDCLRVCDIEAMGAHLSLMLSYLQLDHPELHFSDYAAPRLKGLISFYRFANIKTLAHFSRVGKALNAAGIPLLLFKGAAMKALRPALSRPMGDVDFLVRSAQFSQTASLVRELGYCEKMNGTKHSVDMVSSNGEGAVDIHRAFFCDVADYSINDDSAFIERVFARARERRAFGVDVLLPAHEDLFFVVLVNLIKNLREKSSVHGLFYALFDSRFLLSKPGFDWKIIAENARATKTAGDVRLAAEFMNSLVPGLIPDIERHFPLTGKMRFYFDQLVFDECYLLKRRAQCQEIRVVDLKNYPLHYGKRILKLLVLKKLRAFPGFVRWYLDTHPCQVQADAR